MKAMKLWMLATILFCGSTMLFTSCSNEDNAKGSRGQVIDFFLQISHGDRFLGIPRCLLPLHQIIDNVLNVRC